MSDPWDFATNREEIEWLRAQVSSRDDVIAGLRVQLEWHQAREKRFEAEVEQLREELMHAHKTAIRADGFEHGTIDKTEEET